MRKWLNARVNFPVNGSDRNVEGIDLPKMQFQQKAVVQHHRMKAAIGFLSPVDPSQRRWPALLASRAAATRNMHAPCYD
jgi:hypothetical protein